MKFDYITKKEFKDGLDRFENRLEKKIDKSIHDALLLQKKEIDKTLNSALLSQRKEYERYASILYEEFQGRLGGVIEMYVQNTDDIRMIKTKLQLV